MNTRFVQYWIFTYFFETGYILKAPFYYNNWTLHSFRDSNWILKSSIDKIQRTKMNVWLIHPAHIYVKFDLLEHPSSQRPKRACLMKYKSIRMTMFMHSDWRIQELKDVICCRVSGRKDCFANRFDNTRLIRHWNLTK